MKQTFTKLLFAAVFCGIFFAGGVQAQTDNNDNTLFSDIEAKIAAIRQAVENLKEQMISMVSANDNIELKYKSIDGQMITIPAKASEGGTDSVGAMSFLWQASAAASSMKKSCIQYNPLVQISPAQQMGASGQTLNYVATVTNINQRCPSVNFNITLAVPSGWTVTPAATMISLASGASQTLNIALAAATDAVDGSYSLTVTATNAAYPAYTITRGAAAVVLNSADSTAPTVTMHSPIDGGIYTVPRGAAINIIGTQNDNVGLAKEEILINDKVFYTMDFGTIWFQYFWYATRGTYKVQIAVYDMSGNKTLSNVANIVVQ
jgi:hypothetical protein